MDIYQPYTYLIGWSALNVWYYGVRYAKNCNPSDLWTTYYTSSKEIIKFRNKHGEPDVVQIRKIFKDSLSARLWEEKVLVRMKVVERADFLNKTNNRSIPSPKGVAKSESHKRNISKSRIEKGISKGENNPMYGKRGELSPLYGRSSHMRNKKHKEETKKILSLKLSGENNPMFGIRRFGSEAPMFGKKHNEEAKAKMRKPKTNTEQMKNKIYINDGISNKKIHKDASIPIGWYKGRLSYKAYSSSS